NESVKVDVRVIAATNRNLKEEVAAGRFRQELYYRLNVMKIEIPPLRERTEDIPLVAFHLLEKYNRSLQKKIKGFSSEVMRLFEKHSWPGNVRELENEVERLVVLTRDGEKIDADLVSEEIKEAGDRILKANRQHSSDEPEGVASREVLRLKDLKVCMCERAFREFGGNVSAAARALGISRDSLYGHLRKRKGDRKEPRGLEAGRAIAERWVDAVVVESGRVPSLEELEGRMLRNALEKFKQNTSAAAEALGVSTSTLYRKAKA
ncbi:unnamed protein product, partial [marine sediment metagenome]